MEIQRPANRLPAEHIVDAPKSPGFTRLVELFKGLRTPRHEPIPLKIIHNSGNDTVSLASSTTVTPVQAGKKIIINGHEHEGFELTGQCTYFPTMIVPSEHFQVWDSQIRDRLYNELSQCLRDSTMPSSVRYGP